MKSLKISQTLYGSVVHTLFSTLSFKNVCSISNVLWQDPCVCQLVENFEQSRHFKSSFYETRRNISSFKDDFGLWLWRRLLVWDENKGIYSWHNFGARHVFPSDVRGPPMSPLPPPTMRLSSWPLFSPQSCARGRGGTPTTSHVQGLIPTEVQKTPSFLFIML